MINYTMLCNIYKCIYMYVLCNGICTIILSLLKSGSCYVYTCGNYGIYFSWNLGSVLNLVINCSVVCIHM